MQLAVNSVSSRDDAAVGVNRKQTIGIAGQTVGDRVIGRIQIKSVRRDADRGADNHVFNHFVGRSVHIGRDGNIKFIDIVDVDDNSTAS